MKHAASSEPWKAEAVDVAALIDGSATSRLQIAVVLLAALSIILDGFDGQLFGFALPVLIAEWDVPKADFAPVVAMGLLGMAVGSGVAGYAADLFGRRLAIVGSILTFGLATIAIGFSADIVMVGALRFIAGLGIGGALPTSTTMAAEFMPARNRTVAVTATIVCVPVGGMFAGIFASQILPAYGWTALFHIGGAIPVFFALVLFMLMPESPRWLARCRPGSPELARLLARCGHGFRSDIVFVDGDETSSVRDGGGLRAIVAEGRAGSSYALWTAFFLTLLSVYLVFSWLPTLLSSEGLDVAQASAGLTLYNLGGIFGALTCAFAIKRFGSRWPLVFCCAGAAGSALLLSVTNIVAAPLILTIGIAINGLFVNAVQSTMYAVSANLYPTHVRASGTAVALIIGRMGAIASAFAGAAVIATGGGKPYFMLIVIAMLGSLFALLILRKHISAPTPLGRRSS
ncbi:MFS transporter [Sphingobium sp. BYY-5]|uniref:MFS transporter n=1 Tax=Sphingobium sp. BYY-5 TaxID=2926400 RepID=UPI001FA6E8C4|nr:MFS transporter [Sphingobium sp. BYY-5]MCI4592383.1 MFS transporter [Sphingobium sp. BYY-5]